MSAPLSISSVDESLLVVGADILQNRATSEDATYFHSIMCQVGLPRSKVDGTTFERRCGGAVLLVKAGALWDGEQFVPQIIPYGALPRCIFAWMNTVAIQEKSPVIEVGHSASHFMKMLGKKVTGGNTGTIQNFKTQIQALSSCSMTLGFNASGMANTFNGQPIKHFEAKFGHESLWPEKIILSDEYFRSLEDRAVPLDIRAFTALSGSALALDIYCWLAQRLHRIEGRPVLLHWANLRDQFGQEYTGKDPTNDFKKSFLKSLDQVLAVYQLARVKRVNGGLLLMASHPPVPYRVYL